MFNKALRVCTHVCILLQKGVALGGLVSLTRGELLPMSKVFASLFLAIVDHGIRHDEPSMKKSVQLLPTGI